MMSDEVADWVYAVMPGSVSGPPPALTGVLDEPVRLVRAAELAAVVGSVPSGEVTEERLQEQLADPDWLERVVRAHHEVVTACFEQAPTVPFRLATVYHRDERVVALLHEQATALRDALDTVAFRAEWGVQAYAVLAEADPAPGEPVASDRPGTDYLLRRRAERARRQQARAEAVATAQKLDAVLATQAVAVHRSPPVAQPDDGLPEPMVLNASYLVDDDRIEEFTSSVDDLLEQLAPLRVRLTGPWPAYSFVTAGVG